MRTPSPSSAILMIPCKCRPSIYANFSTCETDRKSFHAIIKQPAPKTRKQREQKKGTKTSEELSGPKAQPKLYMSCRDSVRADPFLEKFPA